MRKTVEVFATRKIARNVARARMGRMGVAHPNKCRYGRRNGVPVKLSSYFALHWREVAAR